ncbi:MAG: hypothetical protein DPW09_00300 [Anaerolineae bacterium]|nr:oligosaccharide flippase family protein [Anaerolineales bacterium]MCQ3971865.1 hypothetical protein [Anaerolineae bacterium]
MLKYLRQIASESIVYGLSGVILRFLTIFLVPIYTRIFTPEDYGVLSLVTSTILVASTLATLSLDSAAHRWYWETEELRDRKCTIATWVYCHLGVTLIFAAVIFLSASWLGRVIVGRADAGKYFQLAAFTLPLNVLWIVANNWLRMQRRPWSTTFHALANGLLIVSFTFLFVVVFRWGLEGIFSSQILAFGGTTILSGIILGGWINPKHFHWVRFQEMFHYALPLIPASLALWVISFSDRYFIQIYTSTHEVGLYQVGSVIAAPVAIMSNAFQQAWWPFALSIYKRPDAKQVYANVFLAYIWITALISTALALFAPEAIWVFATEQYLGASSVVGILALGYVMMGLYYIASTGPNIVKATTSVGIVTVIAAGLNVLFNFILVPYLGKEGSALATLLSQSVVPVILFYRSQKLYPVPYRFMAGGAIFVLAFVLIAIGGYLQFDQIIWGIVFKLILMSLFVPVLFLLRILTIAQARQILNINWRSSPVSGN